MMRLCTRIVVITVFLVTLGLVALLALTAKPKEPREVTVVARQMSFYVDDVDRPNPTIRVWPSERIRLSLVNKDPGFDHDFAITAWGVRTTVLRGEGHVSVVFHASNTPGKTDYVCLMHAAMMTGTIEVLSGDKVASSER